MNGWGGCWKTGCKVGSACAGGSYEWGDGMINLNVLLTGRRLRRRARRNEDMIHQATQRARRSPPTTPALVNRARGAQEGNHHRVDSHTIRQQGTEKGGGSGAGVARPSRSHAVAPP